MNSSTNNLVTKSTLKLVCIYFQVFSTLLNIKSTYCSLFTDKAPSEATFRGAEFLSYNLSRTGGEPIVSNQDAISLLFKTRQPSGLLLYTGENNQVSP